MAMAAILRRSASSASPLLTRLVHTQTRQHTAAAALFTALYHHNARPSTFSFSQFNHFSTSSVSPSTSSEKPSSDVTLLSVLEEEIKCAEESDTQDQVEGAPAGFPFKIEDNPGHQTVLLKRDYEGETIEVEVHMPALVTGEETEDDDGNDDENQKTQDSSLPLVVRVLKNDGHSLQFTCTAFPDEVQIDSLAMKAPENVEDEIAYEGPDFSDLDENLQKAFHKYLEIRGIKPSTTNFLHEYMMNKDSKEYMQWLKNLKKFVEV